ncbi:MAG TPA: CDP-alcohol phosphatidyltransferase family protein [Polyangiaceae bacterium]|nr:CDP-alcohol phosphatidyltransferase family protein [Polyangiaceae bacterium]
MSSNANHWIAGQLTGIERIFGAAGPVLLLMIYFGVAGILYGLRRLRNKPFCDAEIAQRAAGLGAYRLRHFFAWTMRPWCSLLTRAAIPPNVITSLSVVFALGAGLAVAPGRFALGGWLFVLAGVLDFLDGRVARSTGKTTLGGAALDSVLDRYVESAMLIGLAWYYRHSWVLVACLLALTGSLLVPYVRARAESLGVSLANVGFMQRPERVVLLGVGTALSPIIEVLLAPGDAHPPHRLAIIAMVVLGVTSHATALQRLYRLIDTLGSPAGGTRLTPPSLAQPARLALGSVVATLADCAVASGLAYALQVHAGIATALGCVVGAGVSFVLARGWAFEATGHWLPQLGRYAGVSAATAGLNSGGVVLLLNLNAPFLVAWWCTRIVVFATWSYPLQRDFVFSAASALPSEATLGSRS